MEYWSPKGEGEALRAVAHLEPLAPYKDQMLVLVGHQGELELHPRRRLRIVSHRHAARRTRTKSKSSPTSPWINCSGRHFAQETQLASLEMSMDLPANAGACTGNLSCAYLRHAVLAQSHAAAADGVESAGGVRKAVRRQRQHGPGRARGAPAAAQEHSRFGDRETGRTSSRNSGPQDQGKVDEYTDAVRDVERRIQMAERQSDIELPSMAEPQGAPPVFEDHLALMNCSKPTPRSQCRTSR